MNDTNKRNMIILAVLGIGVVIFVGRALMPMFMTSSSSSANKTSVNTTPRIQVQTLKEVDINADELLANIQPVTFIYETSRIDRNPMTPLVGTLNNAGSSDLPMRQGSVASVLQKRVTGIVWDKFSPTAIVDDEIVTLGYEYPDGVRVYSIESDQVTFQVGDTRIPVKMKEL